MGDGIRLRRRIGKNGLIYNGEKTLVQGVFTDLSTQSGRVFSVGSSSIHGSGNSASARISGVDFEGFTKLCFIVTTTTSSDTYSPNFKFGLAKSSALGFSYVSGCSKTVSSVVTKATYKIDISNADKNGAVIGMNISNAYTNAQIYKIWLE